MGQGSATCILLFSNGTAYVMEYCFPSLCLAYVQFSGVVDCYFFCLLSATVNAVSMVSGITQETVAPGTPLRNCLDYVS